MSWVALVAYFFGGLFAANAIPHVVSGLTGRAFQTPFAKPPGRGLSSSTVNFAWGFANVAAAYLLVLHVGTFDVRNAGHVAAFGVGALLIGLPLSRHFGKFHGGDL